MIVFEGCNDDVGGVVLLVEGVVCVFGIAYVEFFFFFVVVLVVDSSLV